jgi:hypothetical protein
VIDIVLARIVENRLGGIDRFQHVERRLSGRQLQIMCPVLEADKALHMAAVALVVETRIDGQAGELQHIETGKPRFRGAFENASHSAAQRRRQLISDIIEVEGNCDDWRIGKAARLFGGAVDQRLFRL